MRNLKLIALAGFLLINFSCKKDTPGKFVNKLTFGTSVNYSDFTLNGEGSSFSISPGNVAFRLESEEDYNGNPIKFVILKDGMAYSTEIYSNNPKPTGHIYITTLNYGQTGSYSVTAYIQKSSGDQSVASGTFQMM
jgi:hypothetical protein